MKKNKLMKTYITHDMSIAAFSDSLNRSIINLIMIAIAFSGENIWAIEPTMAPIAFFGWVINKCENIPTPSIFLKNERPIIIWQIKNNKI